ncbi:MAG: hypothetical protein EOO77_25075 [Oxalobacteraceae bacterium]|nr:MAG: hypothetical protein EOO77_25075 [Oxalobacteraceae bacterium]
MNQLSQVEIANWSDIYLAAAIWFAIAVAREVSVMVQGLYQDKAWEDVRSVRGGAPFLPKAWMRWQKLYLLSTPATLGIVSYYAATMTWS